MEQRISIERLEQAVNLFGSFDGNIRLLEQEFSVSVTNRDGELRINGDVENTVPAAKAIQALLTLSSRGESILACAPHKKHNIIVSEDMLYGGWELVGKEQVNYPNIEFLKDSSAVLHSQADTIYRFTFFIRNDSLVLVDINGNKHVNKICELNDKTVVLDGIADVHEKQTYKR